ncbi:UNVERIFIED_CONTAM: hypothetical protein GTU68_044784 [Idotea baltica]|nr:hypothetical protein [Idotea baltica]
MPIRSPLIVRRSARFMPVRSLMLRTMSKLAMWFLRIRLFALLRP